MKNRLLAVVIGACLGSVSFGQESSPSQKPSDGDVVRITTNLVQVDAVITDKNGKPITDLKPDELQLSEDNRARKITHFSYIAGDTSTSKPVVRDNRVHGVPPDQLRPEDVRRTIALVVDDLGLSFPSTHFVRHALKQFVDQQMQTGDLVAIIRTSGGIGALQQFTSDRRQLYAAIEHIRWYPGGRAGVGAFAPIGPSGRGTFGAEVDAKNKELEEFRSDLFSVGTLGAISYVVRGLRDLPGRKSILLISDGFKIMDRQPLSRTSSNDRTLQRLQQLIDETSRSSVVIHTINATGLQALSSIRAEDSMTDANNSSGARTADQVEQALRDRGNDAFDLQTGLDYLADETGGISIRNSNDLAGGIKRIIDEKGYYLIGYRPDQTTFDPRTGRRTFHHLSLKVLRAGKFNVRMRNGFYGAVSDNESQSASAGAREQILHALISPFGSAGVRIRLTSLFANDAKVGSFMRSLLHVDGSALTFTDEPDDWHQAQFDVVAVTFGEDGNVVDEVSRVDRLRVRGETYQRVLKAGFVYMVTVPIKKPGAYQLRVALRDQASERVGSASQFVEVPDMKKRRLEISGILLGTNDQAQTELSNFDPAKSAAVRQFRQGESMRYSFAIYNARVDPATGQPQLETQVRVFRDGQPVFTGRVQRFPLNNPPDLSRLSAASAIQLGAEMTPGEYVLQVIVSDLLAGEKYATASRWVDFKIVP
ncbi:MAG TPA: VWA domain-containing protein [Pyrinomonadaceae bacterium]|jgi:VWFA-related protein|nr:VWA domain-containing protein [Pyrinomonadaceae bacterium]